MREAATRIEQAGGAATIVVGDVRDGPFVEGLIDTAVAQTGHVDVMVNNAGVAYLRTVLDGELDDWRAMFDTNVISLLVGCKAAVVAMRAQGTPGHLVNISSVAAREPASSVYGATKHAVNVISNTLRLELLEDPIKVTTIMPGVIATNIARTMSPEALAGIVALTGLDMTIVPGERIPDEVLEQAQVALADFIARPEDVAEAVLYAVTQPTGVHIQEIVVRPNKDLTLY